MSNKSQASNFFSMLILAWQYMLSKLKKKKTSKRKLYGLFLCMGFNCFKATEPLRVDSLLFTIQFPAGPGTQLIDIERIKGRINLGATQWFCT